MAINPVSGRLVIPVSRLTCDVSRDSPPAWPFDCGSIGTPLVDSAAAAPLAIAATG